jgi:hypothetical protein
MKHKEYKSMDCSCKFEGHCKACDAVAHLITLEELMSSHDTIGEEFVKITKALSFVLENVDWSSQSKPKT